MEKYKAYFLMRADLLKELPAKLAINVGHGVDYIHFMGNKNIEQHERNLLWFNCLRKKIVLKVKDTGKLCTLAGKLKEEGILFDFIVDNGITEFDGQTTTGIVIYPISEDKIPQYIKRLRLWK